MPTPAQNGDKKSRTGTSKRIPVRKEIAVRFPHFQEFVKAVSANLSTTGMFIETEDCQPIGSVFTFRFHIEEWELIQGSARVVWTREQSEGDERPAGMGAQFVDLDPQSRRMVNWLVDKHVNEGGQPFHLVDHISDSQSYPDSEPRARGVFGRKRTKIPTAAELLGDHPVADPEDQPRQAVEGELRPIHGIALFTLIILWGFMIGNQLVRESAAYPTLVGRIYRVDQDSLRALFAPREAERASTRNFRPSIRTDPEFVLTNFVQDWAQAWSEQRVDDYLDFYSSEFRPGSGLSSTEWKGSRRERILRPSYIFLAIAALEWELEEGGTARTTFHQTYRSDRYTDMVIKTLDLALEGDEWKIVREHSTTAPPQDVPDRSP